MRHQIESQHQVKSESEQKDFSLADRQRAAIVSLTDNLNMSKAERCDCQAV